MQQQVQQLINAICADYACGGWPAHMVDNFNSNIRAEVKKKYIKIITQGSVWGFVQVQADQQFAAGDILKPAGYNMPARNVARGNIITGGYDACWTGPRNLK